MKYGTGIRLTDSTTNAVITATAYSTDVISNPIDLKHTYGFSLSASWNGSPSGTFYLEACNDQDMPTDKPLNYTYLGNTLANWVVVANSAQLASAGVAISPSTDPVLMWNISNAMYRFVRLHYVRTSGSMNLTARLQTKSPG